MSTYGKRKVEGMITAEVKYGNEAKLTDDAWQRNANPWTVTLKNGRKRMTVNFWTGVGITDDPTAADVLECLLSDASLCAGDFEEFCADLGYSTDSRKALREYQQGKRQTTRLERFLGDDFEALVYSGRDEWPVKVAS